AKPNACSAVSNSRPATSKSSARCANNSNNSASIATRCAQYFSITPNSNNNRTTSKTQALTTTPNNGAKPSNSASTVKTLETRSSATPRRNNVASSCKCSLETCITDLRRLTQ